MKRVRIASQLPPAFDTRLLEALKNIEILHVDRGASISLPDDVETMIAIPFPSPLDAHAVPVPSGWPFNVKWLHLTSVGIDAYPNWIFEVPIVTTSRGTSAAALAEFALAAIFAATKRLPDIWIKDAGEWRTHALSMVKDRIVGIIGYGSIGEALAPRALALGMKVMATRRSPAPIETPGVQRVDDLTTLFQQCDDIVLALPATAETAGIVNRTLLAQAKPGLHLINIARGTLIDDAALIEALDDGRIGLASLDLTHPEPLPAGHPFYTHPRVHLSPHTSVHTPETYQNIVDHFARNLTRFRNGEPLHNVVSLERGY